MRMPWRRHALKRLLIQFPVAVLGGLLVTPVILLPASWFFGLESDFPTLVNNAFYLVVLSLFLMIVLEAGIYFDESAESQLAAQKLQQDLIREASDKSRIETQMLMEEEKNRLARQLIDQEKQLSHSLEQEIKKGNRQRWNLKRAVSSFKASCRTCPVLPIAAVLMKIIP